MGKTLGDLTAYDLGCVVEFADGGATYRGTLTKVNHGATFSPDLRTLVVIENDAWRHIETYPSNTRVETSTPTPTSPEVGRG